jgi:predicted CXXCH cytochrome family protein
MGHDFPASWPEDGDARHRDRSWIPEFCARCHSDTSYMRRFNPGLPTDQLDKYRTSRHGQLLLEAKDSRAAQCTSCHGVHGIQSASSPLSTVYPKRLPETCAHCHADAEVMAGFTLPDGRPLPTSQYEQYRASVHGRALLERGDLGAPACNDCHGNHAAMPPEVSSVAQVCRTCHSQNGTLFDGSRHKQAFERHGWPECGSCHGEHAIAKTSDAMMAPGPESVCNGCHAKFAQENPECDATAAYFHAEIVGLQTTHDGLTHDVELLERRGLDTAAMHDELDSLFDSVKQTRSYVHSFERSELAAAAAPAHASIETIAGLMASARDELRYRFRGLVVASLFIAVSIAVLWLRIRWAERNRAD